MKPAERIAELEDLCASLLGSLREIVALPWADRTKAGLLAIEAARAGEERLRAIEADGRQG